MAEMIQEISAPPNHSAVVDDQGTNSTRPIPAKRHKRPTIIKPNLVASGNSSSSGQELSEDTSSAVKPKQPPPRPSDPPSRPPSIYKAHTSPSAQIVPHKEKDPIETTKQETKVKRRRPEIKVVSARPLSEVIGFGKGALGSNPSATGAPVPSKRLSLNMDSSNTPAAPPPLPSTRPKGKYVPPPLPTNRPKGAYVHPVSVGSTPSSGSSTPEPRSTPVPKPRSNSASHDQILNNHVGDSGTVPSNKPVLPPHPVARTQGFNHIPERPVVSQKPSVTVKPTGSTNTAPVAASTPTQRTSAPISNFNPPVGAKPPVAAKPASPPKQTPMSELMSLFGSNTSTIQPTPAAKPQQNTKSSSDLGWQIASGIANNITAKDVQRAAGAVSAAANSEAGRAFGNAAVKTASSSSDPRFQLAGSAAQNVNARDISRAADTVGTVAASEQGQKAASTAWNFAQNNRGQVNTAFSSSAQNTTSAASTKSSSNFDLLTGLFSSTPSQPAATTTSKSSGGQSLDDLLGFDPIPLNKPIPAAGASLPPPGPSAAKSGAKPRPTIIRPGAKPSSRSASPKVELEGGQNVGTKSKKPPPRPSAAPQKRAAPPRPGPPGSRKQAPAPPGGGLKPKRLAPTRPAPGKPGAARKSSKDLKSNENLPPRPGPGHPLYKYTVSEPHAVAQFDYEVQNADELSFKVNDTIILTRRIDADWRQGQLGSSEGLLPVQFVKIVRDVAEEDSRLVIGGVSGQLTGPRAVAHFTYDAASPDDLSFQQGDSIKLLEKISDEWYKGECRGQMGMFPVNYVEIVEDIQPSIRMDEPDILSGPRCKAKFDYDSTEPSDLSFPSGAIFKLLEHVGDDWLKGELHGKTGIFPSSFVDIVEDVVSMPSATPSATINGISSGNVAKAVYDFDAGDSTEVSFKEGDMITVLNQVNSEWLYGEVRGQKGRFPATFIDHIPPNLSVLSTPTDSSPSDSFQGKEETCVAQFDFDAGAEGELSIQMGDTITVIEHVGDEWIRGRLNGKEGLFPKAFVELGGGSGSGFGSDLPSALGSGTALYDFDGETSDELTFKVGDVITQIDKFTEEWYEGQLNGKRGKFPAAFVEMTS